MEYKTLYIIGIVGRIDTLITGIHWMQWLHWLYWIHRILGYTMDTLNTWNTLEQGIHWKHRTMVLLQRIHKEHVHTRYMCKLYWFSQSIYNINTKICTYLFRSGKSCHMCRTVIFKGPMALLFLPWALLQDFDTLSVSLSLNTCVR